MVDRSEPPRDLDRKPLPMRPGISGQYVRYCDLDATHTKMERLKWERDYKQTVIEKLSDHIEKAEAERDANAKWLGELLAVIHRDGGHYQSQHGDEKAVDEAHMIVARLLTERDEALAIPRALEAYGRKKMWEGMRMAAEIIRGRCPECLGTGLRDSGGVHPWGEPISVPCDCAGAILAEMETLK